MISVFGKDTTDFSTNGLFEIGQYATIAQISEQLNGDYSLEIQLAQNPYMNSFENDMVVRVSAPIRETPEIDLYTPPQSGNVIYKVTTSGANLRLRTGPGTNYKVLKSYKNGTHVIVKNTSNSSWYKVVTPDGKKGYMASSNLTYVRTETSAPTETGTIAPKQTREQLFKVKSISSSLDGITIKAEHISYDLRGNYIKTASGDMKKVTGTVAAERILDSTVKTHNFNIFADVTKKGTIDIERKNPIEAIMGGDGLIETYGGEILRDNFDIYYSANIGYDRGVTLAYRKNITGMEVTIDTTDVITQIIPIGFKKNGDLIFIDDTFVNSPHINDYDVDAPRILEKEYREIKVGDDYADVAAVKAALVAAATAEYENCIDLPTVEATVDYVDLKRSLAPEEFFAYTDIFLGDTVHIRHENYGFDIAIKCVAYCWDCLAEEFISLELGSLRSSMSNLRIDPSLIGDSSLTGRKIAPHTIIETNIRPGAITRDKINIPDITGIFDELSGNVSDAITEAQTNIENAHERLTLAEGRLTSVEGRITDSEGNVTALQQTAQGLTSDAADAQGNISTLQQTAQGLTSDVADVQGNISTLQQTAQELVSDVADAQGNISALQQRADSIVIAVSNKLDASDPSVGVQTSGIAIRSSGVLIETPIFGVNVSGVDGDMSLDENGLSVSRIDSPSIVTKYTGASTIYVQKTATDAQVEAGTYYRSIGDALASINLTCLSKSITIIISNDTYYESCNLQGITGGGTIIINGNGATVYGAISFNGISCAIRWSSLNISNQTVTGHGLYFGNCRVAAIDTSDFSAFIGATNSYGGIVSDWGSTIIAYNCAIYGTWRAIICRNGSTVYSYNNKGNARLYVSVAHMVVSGTQPCDSTSFGAYIGTAGVLTQAGNVSVNQGIPGAPTISTITATFNATTTRTTYGSSTWPSTWKSITNVLWQGFTSEQDYQVAMLWFSGLSSIYGKTIKAASLTLKRVSGIGKGSAVKVIGYYGTRIYSAGSGAPTDRSRIGTLGKIDNGERKQFTIPTSVITYLSANPSGRCIALHSGDSEVMSGKSYSTNYAKFCGLGNDYVPVLTVTYEN